MQVFNHPYGFLDLIVRFESNFFQNIHFQSPERIQVAEIKITQERKNFMTSTIFEITLILLLNTTLVNVSFEAL